MAVKKDVEYVKFLGDMIIAGYRDGSLIKGKRKINGHEADTSTMSGVKKAIREIYKERVSHNASKKNPEFLINYFCNTDESGESASNVWILKNTPEAVEYIYQNIGVEETKNNYSYSPTGLWFSSRAYITETSDRIFVRKYSTLDC